MMKIRGSYKIDGFSFIDQEAKLLARRTQFRIEELERALTGIKLQRHTRILEIGSGTGHRAGLLARRFRSSEVVGVDVSDEMVRRSNKNFSGISNLTFQTNDIFGFAKAQSGTFDLIYMR